MAQHFLSLVVVLGSREQRICFNKAQIRSGQRDASKQKNIRHGQGRMVKDHRSQSEPSCISHHQVFLFEDTFGRVVLLVQKDGTPLHLVGLQ